MNRVMTAGVLTITLSLSLQLFTCGQSRASSEMPQQSPSSTGLMTRQVTRTFDFLHDKSLVIRRGPDFSDPEKSGMSTAPGSAGKSATLNPQGWDTVMYETFEGPFPSAGWTVTGDPAWDDQNCMALNGSWSAWCARGGTQGVWPCPGEVHYANNMNTWMIYGPFDVSDANIAQVNFYRWMHTESGYDWFGCMTSVNGIDFSGTEWSGVEYGAYSGWVACLVGIPTQVPAVWLAFTFRSDGSVTDSGVYIDDIHVKKLVLPNLRCYSPTLPPILVTCSSDGLTQCSPHIMAGEDAFYGWSVGNLGHDGTTAPFRISLVAISGPGTPFTIWDDVVEYWLQPEDWVFITPKPQLTVNFPAVGTYLLELCADVDNSITESDEDDNCCRYTLQVSCECTCHADPQCDDSHDIVDVVNLIEVAFRGGAPIFDPVDGCPYQPTDVDCSGSTDIVDVTLMINVAFRGWEAGATFCNHCP